MFHCFYMFFVFFIIFQLQYFGHGLYDHRLCFGRVLSRSGLGPGKTE